VTTHITGKMEGRRVRVGYGRVCMRVVLSFVILFTARRHSVSSDNSLCGSESVVRWSHRRQTCTAREVGSTTDRRDRQDWFEPSCMQWHIQ